MNSKFCCESMRYYLNQNCDKHSVWECPDAIIIRIANGDFGLPIKDGGQSYIKIKFCPWCGEGLKK